MPEYKGEKLTDDNFNDFAFGFLAFAKTRETDGIYEGTDLEPSTGPNSKAVKAWRGRAALAAADLIASVDKKQFKHLRGIQDDAREMWTTLELFHTSGQASSDSLATWNAFFDAKYIDYSIPLKSHIGDILEIVDQLTNIFSDPPSPSQIIARILASLPSPEFDGALRTIKEHPKADNRAWVVGFILKEEYIIRRGGGLTPSLTSTVFATTAEAVVCSNCKRRGHANENCFHPGGGKEGQFPEWWNKRHEPCSLPPLHDVLPTLSVFHRIKFTTEDPYTARGPEDSIVDSIHVQPSKILKNGELLPARFDTALINDGTGYRVVQIHVIFSLGQHHLRHLFLPGIVPPKYLAYVEWFSPFTTPEPDHLMYKIKRSVMDGERLTVTFTLQFFNACIPSILTVMGHRMNEIASLKFKFY
ncbi:hypothetical protein C8R43DRAFT_944758 [Mycena crocata]|nr:hypothetical protein C8R43DRAFT_944758 [Mycena crocata]